MKTSIKRCTLALIMCGMFGGVSAQTILTSESFNTNAGTGGTNNNFPAKTSGNALCSNGSFTGNSYDADKCVFLAYNATESKIGKYTTNSINIKNSCAVLSFKAAGCNNNRDNTFTLSVSNGDVVKYSKNIVIPKKKWSTYEYAIVGNNNSPTKISISGCDIYLDDVVVRTVNENNILTLDENDPDIYSKIMSIYNSDDRFTKVILRRTRIPNIWCTFCFPFAVTNSLWNTASYNPTIGNMATSNGRIFQKVSGNNIIFSADTNIPAGQPFLAKFDYAAPEITFPCVEIEQPTPLSFGTDNIKLMGTYAPYELQNSASHTEAYFGTDQKLHTPTAGMATMKGMRAYIALDGIDASRVILDLDDGETLSLSELMSKEETTSQYYNLQGLKVTTPQKGLYIVNGKKVLIK